MNRWFLLDDGAASGAENMARDEFLLERAGRPGAPPVLRLYRFDPPALTIGYHQDPSAVLDLDAVRGGGVDLVRRITGGRALLHDGELTYAVAASSSSEGFGAGLTAACGAISRAVAAALRALGISAEIVGSAGSAVAARRRAADGGGLRRRVAPCLVSVGRYEITVRGRKIAGSAQRRMKSAFLQHGSILLAPASGRIAQYATGDWPFLEDRITSIIQESGGSVGEAHLRASLRRAFESAFDARLEDIHLSAVELRGIGRRAREKRDEFASILGREAGHR